MTDLAALGYPLPWTLEEDERYEGGAPVYIIKAAGNDSFDCWLPADRCPRSLPQ